MQHHKISLLTAILMNINIMVGSGILIGPTVIAGIAGNASFLTWFIVALIFLPIVLSLVQLSRMCPGAGGFYAYAKEGLSNTAAYWSGWLYISGYTFTVIVEILALRKILLVSLGENWLTANPMFFYAVTVSAVVAVNMLSLKVFSQILNSLTISKIIPLITLIILIPFVFNPGFRITGEEISMLPYSLPFAIFGYFGFEYCCSISHLIEDSERNAPRALLIGFFATALIYTLFHFGLLNLMGAENLAKYGGPAFADFIQLPIPFLKPFLQFLIPLASAITLFAAACGLLNANAVMIHSMAEERLFVGWPTLVQMTSWYRPWVTIVIQGLLVFAIATVATYTVGFLPSLSIIANLCNMGIACSFILPLVSLFALQSKSRKGGNRLMTVLGLISATGLSLYSMYALAPDMTSRVLYVLPMIGLLIVGALIMRKDGRDQKIKVA